MSQIEVCSGVFAGRMIDVANACVVPFNAPIAYGPGLEAALATAVDVATLDAWRRAVDGRIYQLDLCAFGGKDERAAKGGAFARMRLVHDGGSTWFYSETDEPLVAEREARRAAADAIRNGKVTP